MARDWTTLRADLEEGVLRVRLHRPQVRNAFNGTMVRELTSLFEDAGTGEQARVVVLSGEGACFSAGADLEWMREQAALAEEENRKEAERMARMFLAVARCPLPVVARIHGAALGGGSGLACAADVAVAAEDAILGFTEARLGIVPAVISPFVVRRIGASRAAPFFLTGARVTGAEAARVGLVHRAVPPAGLDPAVEEVVQGILACGPAAVRECKRLLAEVAPLDLEGAVPLTSALIARVRATPEATEGMAAFLEKRPPAWRRGASQDGGKG